MTRTVNLKDDAIKMITVACLPKSCNLYEKDQFNVQNSFKRSHAITFTARVSIIRNYSIIRKDCDKKRKRLYFSCFDNSIMVTDIDHSYSHVIFMNLHKLHKLNNNYTSDDFVYIQL